MPQVLNPKTGSMEFYPQQAPVTVNQGGHLSSLSPHSTTPYRPPNPYQSTGDPGAMYQQPPTGIDGRPLNPEATYAYHQQMQNAQMHMRSPQSGPLSPEAMGAFLNTLPNLTQPGEAYLMHSQARNEGRSVGGYTIEFDARGVAVIPEPNAMYCEQTWPELYKSRAGHIDMMAKGPSLAEALRSAPLSPESEKALQAEEARLDWASFTVEPGADEDSRLLNLSATVANRDAEIETLRSRREDHEQAMASMIENMGILQNRLSLAIEPEGGVSFSPVHRELMKASLLGDKDTALASFCVLHPDTVAAALPEPPAKGNNRFKTKK